MTANRIVRREAFDQPADAELRDGAADQHQSRDAAHQYQRHVACQPLIDDFRQRYREQVEHGAGAQRDADEHAEQHDHGARRQRDRGGLLACLGVMAVVGRDPEIINAGRDREHGRRKKGHAPAEPCGEQGR